MEIIKNQIVRKQYSVLDFNGVTRYTVHGTSIRAEGNAAEVLDYDSQEQAFVIKAVIGLSTGSAVVEVEGIKTEEYVG